jgi:hypothetical protein
MLSFGKVKCFNCNKKVKKKKAFTTVITTAEGELVLKTCESCSTDLDELLEEIETVKELENKIG